MKVHGFTLSEEQISAMVGAMGASFTTNDVANAAVKAGVPMFGSEREWIANRAADRLIQKMRRKGTVRLIGYRTFSLAEKLEEAE